MKKKRIKHIDIDDMKPGTALDVLVAKNIYKRDPKYSTWFVKDGRAQLYYGPQFSTDMADALTALKLYTANNNVLSFKLDQHMIDDPYSCTAEIRFPGQFFELSYVRSWAPTLPLAIARVLAKVPKK